MEKVTELKVLGAGCSTCEKLVENLELAVKNIGLDVKVEHVTNLQEIAKYEALSLPCIIINDQKVYGQKIMNAEKVEKLLRKVIGA